MGRKGRFVTAPFLSSTSQSLTFTTKTKELAYLPITSTSQNFINLPEKHCQANKIQSFPRVKAQRRQHWIITERHKIMPLLLRCHVIWYYYTIIIFICMFCDIFSAKRHKWGTFCFSRALLRYFSYTTKNSISRNKKTRRREENLI